MVHFVCWNVTQRIASYSAIGTALSTHTQRNLSFYAYSFDCIRLCQCDIRNNIRLDIYLKFHWCLCQCELFPATPMLIKVKAFGCQFWKTFFTMRRNWHFPTMFLIRAKIDFVRQDKDIQYAFVGSVAVRNKSNCWRQHYAGPSSLMCSSGSAFFLHSTCESVSNKIDFLHLPKRTVNETLARHTFHDDFSVSATGVIF